MCEDFIEWCHISKLFPAWRHHYIPIDAYETKGLTYIHRTSSKTRTLENYLSSCKLSKDFCTTKLLTGDLVWCTKTHGVDEVVLKAIWVIARNTCPTFHHMFIAEVVLCHKYCKNDWMNMKFRNKLPIAI